MRGRRTTTGLLLTAALLTTAACTTGTPEARPTSATPSSPAAPSTPGTPAPPTPTDPGPSSPAPSDPLAGWSLEEKVGRLLVVGVDLTDPQPTAHEVVADRHVGGIFLHGRSQGSPADVRAFVDGYTALAGDLPLTVSTDQEGGVVQVLGAPGFTAIPDGPAQAALGPQALRSQATAWGTELAAAGVTLDLAPVVDLVDPATADRNAPIGHWARQYGATPQEVVPAAEAFCAGLADAGVGCTVKHFPGLGAVTANTDDTADVHDTVTGADSPSVDVYRALLAAGADRVMVSSATYDRIDPSGPAVFSSAVVTGLLRGTLGYDGLVMTDDLSGATAVEAWSPGERAVRAVEAGCDLVLASKVPEVADEMLDALLDRARTDPAFAARVDESARRVLAAQQGDPAA